MKILYAIQGTGNGHLSRAMDVTPALQQFGEVDLMVSGAQADIKLPFEVKYQSKGLSFYFGKNGGIDLAKTFAKNSTNRVLKEIKQLPVEQYDLIINDFEPISAWASKLKGKKVVALSHQSALLSDKCPKPDSNDFIGQTILKNYAPADVHYGFHFHAFDKQIYTPIIKQSIREKQVKDLGHYAVYLPAYDDAKIIKVLSQIKSVDWQVFSKHTKKRHWFKNVAVEPVNQDKFIKSMISATGVLCGAGFETPSEVMYLGKKLMVIPMKGQYEQQCNAAALRELGVPVINKLSKKYHEEIEEWVQNGKPVSQNYQDETYQIIEKLIANEC